MWRGNFMLGGEIGGNLLINDRHHTAADAVYTSLVLASTIVQNKGISLRSVADQLVKHPQKIISFTVLKKFSKEQLEEIENKIGLLRKNLGEGSRILFWESATEQNRYRVLAEGGYHNTQEEVNKAALAGKQIMEQVVSASGFTSFSQSQE